MSKHHHSHHAAAHAHHAPLRAGEAEQLRRHYYDLGYNRAQMWIVVDGDELTMRRIGSFRDRWESGDVDPDVCINCAFAAAAVAAPRSWQHRLDVVSSMLGQEGDVDPHLILGFGDGIRDALVAEHTAVVRAH